MVIPGQGWSIPADDSQFGTSTLVLHGQQPDFSVSEIPGSAVVRVVVKGEGPCECEPSAEVALLADK